MKQEIKCDKIIDFIRILYTVIKKTNKNKPHYLSFADADIIKELMEGFITYNK